jgi:hypothetical protein
MNQAGKDWAWAASIAATVTAISTAALIASVQLEVSSSIQRLSRVLSYLGAPGALSGVALALLTLGSYGGSGALILTVGAYLIWCSIRSDCSAPSGCSAPFGRESIEVSL